MRIDVQCRSGGSSVDDHAAAPLCSGATRGIQLYSAIQLYTAIHSYTRLYSGTRLHSYSAGPAGRALLRE